MTTGGWSFKQQIEHIIRRDTEQGNQDQIAYVWVKASMQHYLWLRGNKLATEDQLKSLPAIYNTDLFVDQKIEVVIDPNLKGAVVCFDSTKTHINPVVSFDPYAYYNAINRTVENYQAGTIQRIRINPFFSHIFHSLVRSNQYEIQNRVHTQLVNGQIPDPMKIIFQATKSFKFVVDDRCCEPDGHLMATIDNNDTVVGEPYNKLVESKKETMNKKPLETPCTK